VKRLRETPKWNDAVREAIEQYGHAYDAATFALAGEIQLPACAEEAQCFLVLDALRLADAIGRCGRRRRRPRFDLRGRARGTNVIRVSQGLDSSGLAYAHYMSPKQVRVELRNARRAALYRLTMRPIANDNDPEPGHAFQHTSAWPSRREPKQPITMAPGLKTHMRWPPCNRRRDRGSTDDETGEGGTP
jgi:hypothetical protein